MLLMPLSSVIVAGPQQRFGLARPASSTLRSRSMRALGAGGPHRGVDGGAGGVEIAFDATSAG